MTDATNADARIVDRSLTHVGDREQASGAIRALFQHTLRRMLGLRRPARAKFLPITFMLIPYAPAFAFVGLAAIIPSELAQDALPEPDDYYGLVITALVLFVALVGPLALAPDRKHRTLSLFLASRLTRTTYLVATGGALLAVLLTVTVGPPLLVQVALALLDVPGPAIVVVLARSLTGGLILAAMMTAIGLLVSSLTDNRGFAAAGTFVTFIGLGIVGGVFREVLGWGDWTGMVDVLAVAVEAIARVYGEASELAEIATWQVVLGATAWIVIPGALVHWRYRTLAVAR